MTLEEGLVAELKADGALTALIGTRVYRERLPQETPGRQAYPAIVFQRVSTNPDSITMQGPSTLHDVSLRLDILGETAASIEAVFAAVKPLVDGVTDDLGGVTVQHVYITDRTNVSIYDGDQDYMVMSMDLMAMLHE